MLFIIIITKKSKLAEIEQTSAKQIKDFVNCYHAETEIEFERLRSSKSQAEKTLEARERVHKQRIKVLEDQVN